MKKNQEQINKYQQPIGFTVSDWQPRMLPNRQEIVGQYCRLERLNGEKHIQDLYEVYGPTSKERNWTYLPLEPFENVADFSEHIHKQEQLLDPYHFAIVDMATGKALGTLALMRIDAVNGVAEVGFVIYSEKLQRTRIATEAQYLLASYVFDELGYRRYEWKCDALNAPSVNAALRLGFKYEGLFRQAVVYKGRNRDTKWFSIIDSEWGDVKQRLAKWLASENFTENGQQIKKMSDFNY